MLHKHSGVLPLTNVEKGRNCKTEYVFVLFDMPFLYYETLTMIGIYLKIIQF